MKQILFYAAVTDVSLFHTQKFYILEVEILRSLGYEVTLSNNYLDFFRLKYDIAYIFFYTKGILPALIARFRLKKVYFTGGIDDLDPDYANKFRYKRQRLLFRLCRCLSKDCIIVSESDLKNVRNVYKNKLPSKLDLVYHAIKINDFSCNLEEKANNFVTICWMESVRNVQRKGIDISLQYFNYLLSFPKFNESIYFIIGKEGVGTEYLKSMIDEMGLTGKVFFTGAIDESMKIDYLRKSRYYFQMSRTEGFGLAALEALAAKCVIINSGKGGLKEVVGDSGILVDIGKFDNLIYDRIESFDQYILEKAHQRILNNYDFNGRLRKIETILNRN